MMTRSPNRPARFVLLLSLLALGIGAYFYRLHRVPSEAVFSGETQGTTYSIKVARTALNAEQRAATEAAIRKRLDDIDRALSVYRDDSELVRFNKQQTTAPVPASITLVEVLQAARAMSEASEGAFDVTAAPLIVAWGFGPKGKRDTPPTDQELDAARRNVGYGKIEIDPVARTVRKTLPEVACDVNGIAQGYTVDKLAKDLLALGHTDFIVEVGGEVKACGRKADGTLWHAAIEKPLAEEQGFQQVVPLDNMGLTTAGDYHNYYEQDGVRLCHIIDPFTARPITHKLASVSVLHPDCTVADGYDTALMVLGPEKGYALAVKKELAVMFVIHRTGQEFDVRTTPAFDALVSRQSR